MNAIPPAAALLPPRYLVVIAQKGGCVVKMAVAETLSTIRATVSPVPAVVLSNTRLKAPTKEHPRMCQRRSLVRSEFLQIAMLKKVAAPYGIADNIPTLSESVTPASRMKV